MPVFLILDPYPIHIIVEGIRDMIAFIYIITIYAINIYLQIDISLRQGSFVFLNDLTELILLSSL